MEAVQYMLQYFHIDSFLDKEMAMSVFYCLYYYSIADGAGSIFE